MELDEFKILVAQELKQNTTESRRRVADILSSGLLKSLLIAISKNAQSLSEVASRSYIHNNGFVKILLVDCRPQFAVRLHFWPPRVICDSSIHNHPWDMSGKILRGKYTWIVYEAIETNHKEVLNRYQCKYLEGYGGHIFTSKGSISVKESLRIDMAAGCNFELNKSSFHKIIKENEDYVDSIVICGPENERLADVITDSVIEKDTKLYNSNFSPDHIKDHIEKYLNRGFGFEC